MSKQNIVIIDYGAGNVQSVKYAFQRLGVDPVLSNDADQIMDAERVVFPGVGEAAWAMKSLQKNGLDKIIKELKQPVLGICLGMQLMCNFSQEGDTKGLGIFPVNVERFAPTLKVPHMGWNTLTNTRGTLFEGVTEDCFMYFVHSYYVPLIGETVAECDYITPFSAAVQKDNFYACQFHPEKSGQWGEKVLQNFMKV